MHKTTSAKAAAKAYRERNRERIRLEKRAYRKRNAVAIAERKRLYRLANKEAIAAGDKEYRERNREAIVQRKQIYRECNREEIAVRDSKYKRTHRAEINANKRRRTRYDVNFRLVNNIRKRIHNALHGRSKAARTLDLLGCTAEQCYAHLEMQFTPGMSWDNRTEWHIDHIRPIASYDLHSPAQQRL